MAGAHAIYLDPRVRRGEPAAREGAPPLEEAATAAAAAESAMTEATPVNRTAPAVAIEPWNPSELMIPLVCLLFAGAAVLAVALTMLGALLTVWGWGR